MKNNAETEERISQVPVGFLGEFSVEEFNEHDLRLKLYNFLNGKDFNEKEDPQYSRSWADLEMI